MITKQLVGIGKSARPAFNLSVTVLQIRVIPTHASMVAAAQSPVMEASSATALAIGWGLPAPTVVLRGVRNAAL